MAMMPLSVDLQKRMSPSASCYRHAAGSARASCLDSVRALDESWSECLQPPRAAAAADSDSGSALQKLVGTLVRRG